MTKRTEKNPKPEPSLLPTAPGGGDRLLTKAEYQGLAELPPEMEWFANIENERTRKAYQNDLKGFVRFVGRQNEMEQADPRSRSLLFGGRRTGIVGI